jgi:hypothetical protein
MFRTALHLLHKIRGSGCEATGDFPRVFVSVDETL